MKIRSHEIDGGSVVNVILQSNIAGFFMEWELILCHLQINQICFRTSCPERFCSLYLWRYSKPDGCSTGKPALGDTVAQGVCGDVCVQDDLRRNLPNQTIVCFYNNDNISLNVLLGNLSQTKYTDTRFILCFYHTSSQGQLSSTGYILVISFSGYCLILQHSIVRDNGIKPAILTFLLHLIVHHSQY